MSSKKDELCELCDAPLKWDLLTDQKHDPELCERRQLRKAQEENKKLKAAVESWKDAWFEGREIIGKLWLNHPAIDNDLRRAYYQDQQKYIAEVKKNA